MRITWIFLLLLLMAPSHAADPPLAVTAASLGSLLQYPQTEVPASVESLHDSKISAEISSKIIWVGAQVGDHVPKGAILFRLDATDYQLALKRIRANLTALEARRRLAKSQVERAVSLVQKNFISREALNQRQAEFESVTAEFNSLSTQMQEMQRNISKCTIRAPYAGIVRVRSGQLGEVVAPGQPLINLVDATRIEVSARLQPAMLDGFTAAQKWEFVSRSEVYPLKLRALVPLFDARERSQEARLVFVGARATPGESGVLRWRAARPYLPANLLVQRAGRLGIFWLDDDRARFLPLPAAQAGRPASAPGLPAATRIVIEGRYRLNDGDRVRVTSR